MKKLILVALLILIPLSTFAIDQDKLADARNTFEQMKYEIQELIDIVNLASSSNIREITLTAGQKQTLRDAYDNNKRNLVTLYQELP